jgi:hypothetical protein
MVNEDKIREEFRSIGRERALTRKERKKMYENDNRLIKMRDWIYKNCPQPGECPALEDVFDGTDYK